MNPLSENGNICTDFGNKTHGIDSHVSEKEIVIINNTSKNNLTFKSENHTHNIHESEKTVAACGDNEIFENVFQTLSEDFFNFENIVIEDSEIVIHNSSPKHVECSLCFEICEYSKYREHLRNHFDYHPHRCGYCNYSAPERFGIINHLLKDHPLKDMNIIDNSVSKEKMEKYKNQLNIFWKFIKNRKTYKTKRLPKICLTCNKHFRYSKFYLHLKMEAKLHMLSCKNCNYRCNLIEELIKHREENHRILEGQIIEQYSIFCVPRDSVYVRINETFQLSKSEQIEVLYKCAFCKFESYFVNKIRNHLKITHKNKKYKHIRCNSNNFLNFDSLSFQNSFLQTCTKCKTSFISANQFVDHMSYVCHSNSSLFFCQYCIFKSRNKKNVLDHCKKMHKNSKPLKILKHISENKLQNKISQNYFKLSKNDKIICIICQKRYTKIGFKIHLKKHQHITSLKCSYCKYTANSKENVIAHVKMKHCTIQKNTYNVQEIKITPPTTKFSENNEYFDIKKIKKLSRVLVKFLKINWHPAPNIINDLIHNLEFIHKENFDLTCIKFIGLDICSLCGKNVAYNNMMSHIQNNHFKNSQFCCKYCNYSLSSKYFVTFHQKKCHKDKMGVIEIKSNKCKLTGKFSLENRMKQFMEWYDKNSSPLKCENRKMIYDEKLYDLLKNILTHNLDASLQSIVKTVKSVQLILSKENGYFLCPLCTLKFSTIIDFNKHTYRHMKIILLYQCCICSFCSLKHDVQLHCITLHPSQSATVKQTYMLNYITRYCNEIYYLEKAIIYDIDPNVNYSPVVNLKPIFKPGQNELF